MHLKNLVIGSTSQLAHYFPEEYVKISSRNIDLSYLNKKWDSVYITFAEQRIYDSNIDYITPNYINALNIINNIINNCNKVVCYTTCMLWEKLSGKVYLSDTPDFNLSGANSEYIISKLLLLNKIKELQKINPIYNRIIFIHPFYFNSVYRSNYFLFGKIFDSIINKKKIQVNNLNFYRDIVSPQFVVSKSIELKQDSMMGSGQLFNVKIFIEDLYKLNEMNFDDYVEENESDSFTNKLPIIANVDWYYTYENLLEDTQKDILSVKRV